MSDIYKDLFDKKTSNLIEEDEKVKKIEQIENPEELQEAIKLLDEKISDEEGIQDKPSKDEDTLSSKGTDEKSDTPEKGFILTEEIINNHPEDVRGILSKYKNKNAEELAKAVANAIALKSPYLKGNEKVIEQIKEDFISKKPEELIEILVDTQKEVGRQDTPDEGYIESETPDEIFPVIPEEEPGIKEYLEKETLARLKKKYPNMPEITSMDSEEYKEWRRDLDIDNPDNNFREDLKQVKETVKQDISKIVFVQEKLVNLYDQSPTEILPILTQENLPKLKKLNDDPMSVFVEDLKEEIELIKNNLKKFNLTEADLGIDLSISYDENGYPTNEVINQILVKGYTPDGTPIPNQDIISVKKGKTRDYIYWLNKGQLAKTFKEQFEDRILTAFFEKKAGQENSLRNKLKKETLKEGSGRSSNSNSNVYTLEDIDKIENPEVLKKIIAELEK